VLCIVAFSACQKEETTPESIARVAKITQKNQNFKDYGRRPQITYEYDKAGLYVQSITTYLGEKAKRIEKAIYSSNQLVKLQMAEVDYNGKMGDFKTYSENVYDTKNRLVKNISTISNPEDRVESFEYSDNNTKPNKVTVMNKGKLFHSATLTWKNDNLVEMKIYDRNNKLEKVVSYTYDKAPNFALAISPQYYSHGTHSIAQFLSKNNIIETINGQADPSIPVFYKLKTKN